MGFDEIVDLTKGQRINLVDLSKDGKLLDYIIVGLGWEGKKPTYRKEDEHDVDISCYIIGLDEKRLATVFFDNKIDIATDIRLSGDDKTGRNKTTFVDNEQISLFLSKIGSNVERVDIWANIYDPEKKHFGDIKNAYARIESGESGKELCRFNLTDEYRGMTAILVCSLYRKDGNWKFNPIGEGTMNTGIRNIEKTKYN